MKQFPLTHDMPIRIARPTGGLAAAERFYVAGLGLTVLYRHEVAKDAPSSEWSLLMLGVPGAAWHLELTYNPQHPLSPTPTAEDMLVLYLGKPAEGPFLTQLEAAGGERVVAANPYWDRWGVTFLDPDGYRVVLCERHWKSLSATSG